MEEEVIDEGKIEKTNKKGKGTVCVIILLILIILGLAGYICYDKGIVLSKSKNKTVENKKTNVQNNIDKSKETISNDEAIKIGEELYKKAADLFVSRGGSYEQTQPDQNGVSTDVCYKYNNDGSFTKTNCSEFMGTTQQYYVKLVVKDITDVLTKEMFNVFLLEYNDTIKEYNGEYYRSAGDRGANNLYRTSDLSVVKNEGDIITFDLTSYYGEAIYGQEFDKSKAQQKKTQPFVIKKEDGNWKVDRFVEIY